MSAKQFDCPPDLNVEVLRITLEARMMLEWEDTPDGRTLQPRMKNGLTVEYETSTGGGRSKWRQGLPGILMADEDHPTGGMTYADLCRSFANILDAQADGTFTVNSTTRGSQP